MASIVEEPTSEALGSILREDDGVVVWRGTWVECAVAISRLLRGSLAALLSRRHPLKAADALQLAAAFVWRESTVEDRDFVCLDERLRRAAGDEGFQVLPAEEVQ